MIKIGIVDIHTSHPASFADYLHKGNRARVVAVADDGLIKKRLDDFIAKYNIKNICKNPEDMIPLVDIAFIQSINWDEHLEMAIPFIKAGKAVFIDKPFCGNMKDCEKFEELARSGAKILGSSSLRYCYEVESFKASASEKGEILSVFTNIGVDEFNYGIHAMEMAQGLLGPGAVSVEHIASHKTVDQYLVEYKDGRLILFQTQKGVWQPFTMTVVTAKTTYQIVADNTRIYGALLDKILDFMEKGKAMASVEELTETIKIYLAGKLSKESNKKILLADLNASMPGFDGYSFGQEYARKIK